MCVCMWPTDVHTLGIFLCEHPSSEIQQVGASTFQQKVAAEGCHAEQRRKVQKKCKFSCGPSLQHRILFRSNYIIIFSSQLWQHIRLTRGSGDRYRTQLHRLPRFSTQPQFVVQCRPLDTEILQRIMLLSTMWLICNLTSLQSESNMLHLPARFQVQVMYRCTQKLGICNLATCIIRLSSRIWGQLLHQVSSRGCQIHNSFLNHFLLHLTRFRFPERLFSRHMDYLQLLQPILAF